MNRSIFSRLDALEARSKNGHGPLAVALMADSLPEVAKLERDAEAVRAWERSHNRAFPPTGRVMRVLLVGVNADGPQSGALQ